MFQRQTIQKLHDEKPLAVMVGDLVDRTNVRMIQRGRRSGFPSEAFQRLWVVRDIVREKLDGDESTEHGVLGLVDDSHAATTQFFKDAVMRYGLADHVQEGCRMVGP